MSQNDEPRVVPSAIAAHPSRGRLHAWHLALAVVLTVGAAGAQAPVTCDGPLTDLRLVRLLNEGVTEARVLQFLRTCGIAFELTAEKEALLRTVNATDAVIRAVREAASKRLTAPAASAKARPPTDSSGVQWARIQAGTFEMGCTLGDTGCSRTESPRHRVTISRPFELMTTEVTLQMYRVRVSVPTQPAWNTDARQPLVDVTWDEARAFCTALGGRLPSEAEWEYGARGGRSDWRYPWGNEASQDAANYEGASGRDAWAKSAPVGSFAPNTYGLYDMAGNVWEWVADWHSAEYYGLSPTTDPAGPPSGSIRVLRGGSWNFDSRFLRVSVRSGVVPSSRGDFLGFRCARDVSP